MKKHAVKARKKKTAIHAAAPVHVIIPQPVMLRKTILRAAIDTTQLLKRFEEYRVLRVLKTKAYKQLGRIGREMKTQQKILEKEHLPPVAHTLPTIPQLNAVKAPVIPIQPQEQPRITAPKPAAKKSVHHTEIDRLNAELEKIEHQINTL